MNASTTSRGGPWIAVGSAAKTYDLPESMLYRLVRTGRLANRRFHVGRRTALVISEAELLRLAFTSTAGHLPSSAVAR